MFRAGVTIALSTDQSFGIEEPSCSIPSRMSLPRPFEARRPSSTTKVGENEGAVITAAEFATAKSVSFIVRQVTGLLCVAIPQERTDALELPLTIAKNTDRERTAFAVTVDAVVGTTTGVSPTERAITTVASSDRRARHDI